MLEITSVAGDRLSRLAAPITPARVAQTGSDAMEKFGGAEKLYGCIKDEVEASF